MRFFCFRFFLALVFLVKAHVLAAQCSPVPTTAITCLGQPAPLMINGLDTVQYIRYFGNYHLSPFSIGTYHRDSSLRGLSATTVLYGIGSRPCVQGYTPKTIRVGQPARAPGQVVCMDPEFNGLVAYYDFAQGIMDLSGNGNQLINGGVTGTAGTTAGPDHLGRPTGARIFNGNASLVARSSPSILSVATTGQFTIAYWIRVNRWSQVFGPDAYAAGVSFNNSSHTGFMFRMHPYSNGVVSSSNGWVTGGTYPYRMPLNEWHHLAITYTRTTSILYVDGEPFFEIRNGATSIPRDNADLTLGYDPTGTIKTLNGAMANVRLYNRALNEAEVHWLANDGACMPTTVRALPMQCNTASLVVKRPQAGMAYYLADSAGNRLGDTTTTFGRTRDSVLVQAIIRRPMSTVRLAAVNWGCVTTFPETYAVRYTGIRPFSAGADSSLCWADHRINLSRRGSLSPGQTDTWQVIPASGSADYSGRVLLNTLGPDSTFMTLAAADNATGRIRLVRVVTDTGSCVYTDTVLFTVNPGVRSIQFSGTRATCGGIEARVLAVATTVPLGTRVQYRWSNGDTDSLLTTSVPGLYTLTATIGACSYSDTVRIMAQPTPLVRIRPNRTYCTNERRVALRVDMDAGETVRIQAPVVPGITIIPGSSVPVPGGDSLFFGVNFSAPLDTLYRIPVPVIVTNIASRCQGIDTAYIEVRANPANFVVSRSAPQGQFCEGLPITLSVPATVRGSVRWATGQTTRSIVVRQSGNYQVTVSNGPCSTTANAVVTLQPLPSGDAGPNQTLCPADTVVTLGQSGAGGVAVLYQSFPVSANATEATLDFDLGNTMARATIRYSAAATFPMVIGVEKWTRSLGNSCFRADTAYLTINPGIRAAAIVGDTYVCGTTPVVLRAQTVGTPGVGPIRYLWSTGDTTQTTTISAADTVVLVVTQNGCSLRDTQVVRQVRAVRSEAGPLQTTCRNQVIVLGGNVVLLNGRYRWTPILNANPAWLSAPTDLNALLNTAFVPAADTVVRLGFTLWAQDTLTGCTSLDTAYVDIVPAAEANAGADVTVCAGSVITLGAVPRIAGQRYRWQPALALNQDTLAQPLLTAPLRDTAYTLTYVLTASRGLCEVQDTVHVRVNPRPTGTIVGVASICPGARGISYKLRTTTTSFQSIRWWVNPAVITRIHSLDSITVDWPNIRATSVDLKVLITHTNGCVSDTIRLPVRILPSLRPMLPVGNTLLCAQDSVAVYSVRSSPGSVYTWLPTGGRVLAGQGGNTVTVVWSGVGAHTLRYEENTTADTVCQGASALLSVRVVPAPAPVQILGFKERCGAGSFALQVADRAGSTYTWSVSGAAILTSGQGTSRVQVQAGVGTYTLMVVEQAPNGCRGVPDTVALVVHPDVVANAGTNNRTCVGQTLVLGSARLPRLMYRWRGAVASLSDTISPQPTFRASAAGTYDLVLWVRDSLSGCTATDTLAVQVEGVAGSSVAMTQCQGAALPLGTVALPNTAYAWLPTTHLSNAQVAQPLFLYPSRRLTDTVLVYQRRTTDLLSGCTHQDTVRITVLARPDLRTATPQVLCAGQAGAVGPTFVSAAFRYQWAANAVLPATELTLARPRVVWPAAWPIDRASDTTILLQLVATRIGTSCADTATVPVTYRVVPGRMAGPLHSLCQADDNNAVPSVVLGGIAPTIFGFRWQAVDGLSATNINNPTYTYPTTAPRKDTVVRIPMVAIHLTTGCERADTAIIRISRRPPFSVTPDTTLCFGSRVELRALPENAITIYTVAWYKNGVLLGNNYAIPVVHNDSSGITRQEVYTAVLTQLGPAGCSTQKNVTVTLQGRTGPSLAHNDPWFCPAQPTVRYSVRPHKLGNRYRWMATGGTVLSTDSNGVEIRWLQEHQSPYVLALENLTPAACESPIAPLVVQADKFLNQPACRPEDYPITVPNVITPNADGVNDALVIDNAQYYPQLTFRLYNRYGVPLLDKQGMAEPWHPGADLPAGTYYYQLNTGRGLVLKGFLEVVR